MPVILASREAEIRRIAVGSQPGQIVLEILQQKHPTPNTIIPHLSKGVAQVVKLCLASMRPQIQILKSPKKNKKKKPKKFCVGFTVLTGQNTYGCTQYKIPIG
jgi:hypothetical protein